MNKTLIGTVCLCGWMAASAATAQHRWQVTSPHEITWRPKGDAHADHIEMSGKRVSVVYLYDVDNDGRFHLEKGMV